MSFLPKDEKEPITSNYMRFEEGENTFRVLSKAITGMEWWVTKIIEGEKKRSPKRCRTNEIVPMDELEEDPKTGQLQMPKYFWAMVVWNYQAERVQILHITQKGIQRSMRSLFKNEKWGDPQEYDISVTRAGQGLETEYNTMPNPKSKIDPGIVQMAKDMKINLEALYEGKDPFASSQDEEYDAEQIAKDVEEAMG